MASKGKTDDDRSVVIAKTPSELQKMRLDKLMKNPEKEVVIPDKSKEWNPRGPQEFIRNVWGSSAGAGSGDFHVYRGVRRREYARQKFITEKAKKESADVEYRNKVVENKRVAEEKTAKKRAKRLKKKANQKAKKPKKEDKKEESDDSDDDSHDEEEKTEQCKDDGEASQDREHCDDSKGHSNEKTNGLHKSSDESSDEAR